MNQPDDDFLFDLVEEPRPDFVESLWRELSSLDEQKEPIMVLSRSANGRLPVIEQKKRHDSHHRLQWVATLLVLVLGMAAGLYLMESGPDGVHLANLGGAITPTVSPEIDVTPVPWTAVQEDQDINLALMSAEGNPPDRTVILQVSPTGTWIQLNNSAPAVRLLVDRQNIPDTRINFELASRVPEPGLIVRVSRYNGAEIQPLMIYKPELMSSVTLELPPASDDLIVELMTPLPEGEEIILTAYPGTVRPWPFHRGELCESFPAYCVPLAGGGTGDFATFESPDVRTVDAPSSGEPGVVRGLTTTGTPFIGNPDAPLHVAVFLDFNCAYCGDYFLGDLQRFIEEYVLTGKVRLELVLTTGTRGPASELAAQAALAAGEQGAFWEMVSTLFAYDVGRSTFTLVEVQLLAVSLNLNRIALAEAVESGRYKPLVELHAECTQQNKITNFPSVMVQLGDGLEWEILPDRSYIGLAQWADETAYSVSIPPGKVAVTLPLDSESLGQVSYGIQNGDQVDLWFELDDLSLKLREEIGITDPEDQLAIEGALVVRVGGFPLEEDIMALILAVSPDDAALITKLVDAGATYSIVLAEE